LARGDTFTGTRKEIQDDFPDNSKQVLEQIIKNRKLYQVRKNKTVRFLNVDNASLGDVKDVLATLLVDLKEQRIIK